MRSSSNKWYVLILASLVAALAFGAVFNGMAILLPEIASDLNLNYAEVGFMWGGLSLGIAAFTIIGGMLGDRFGARVVMGLACFVAAISSFLRGTADGFITLTIFMILFGFCEGVSEANLPKTIVTWFQGKSLGLITGILGAGFCFGGAISTMYSATLLSPLLGGWQGVMYLYGIVAIILGIVWITTIKSAPTTLPVEPTRRPWGEIISRVIRSRDLWLNGIGLFVLFFSVTGITGYMPIYFEHIKGMSVSEASNVVSAFIWVSIIGSLVLPILSDKVGRKTIYVPCIVITGICIYLIPMLSGIPLLISVIGCGIFGYGGAVVMHYVVVAESRGIEAAYYGTAFGLLASVGNLGGFVGPTVGGIIADVDASLPFTLWAWILVISLITFCLIKGQKVKLPAEEEHLLGKRK